jgi:hypothetical protein
MKSYTKRPFIVNDITVLVSLIVLTILFVTMSVSAQTITNPWYETRWGGDTGEQNYTEPVNPTPGDDICNLCGGSFAIGYMIPTYAILTRKERKKDEK